MKKEALEKANTLLTIIQRVEKLSEGLTTDGCYVFIGDSEVKYLSKESQIKIESIVRADLCSVLLSKQKEFDNL